MENFVLIGVFVLLGMLFRRLKTFPKDSAQVLNMFALYVSLPALIRAADAVAAVRGGYAGSFAAPQEGQTMRGRYTGIGQQLGSIGRSFAGPVIMPILIEFDVEESHRSVCNFRQSCR